VALSAATQEAVWLKRLLSDIKATSKTPTIIREDNEGAISITRNLISHARIKHRDIKFHYVREAIHDGTTELIYCLTQQITAGILTNLSHIVALKLFNWRWECCDSINCVLYKPIISLVNSYRMYLYSRELSRTLTLGLYKH